ncbi:unnamed protein product [Heligmosomoides polygyrus]|uniref:Uncharacterized protein n=1 Tax=Heligmosomoides polygyrus TaxID=6339 RepID=A0A183GDR3_HELPZ|nr:unnamed protein product [Heligmosomoides polygyrus]
MLTPNVITHADGLSVATSAEAAAQNTLPRGSLDIGRCTTRWGNVLHENEGDRLQEDGDQHIRKAASSNG